MLSRVGVSGIFCAQLLLAAPAFAVTNPSTINQSPAITHQSQVFLSDTTSLIRQDDHFACMQSAGADWKNASTAQRMPDGSPVDLRNLRANTPYAAFVQPLNGAPMLRLAMGFRLRSSSVAIKDARGRPLRGVTFTVEPRQDTLIFERPKDVTRLRAALRAEGGITVSAQSEKLVPGALEHVVTHEFTLPSDREGLQECRALAQRPAPVFRKQLHIDLANAPRAGSPTDVARAMACNRDINPQGAELVAIESLEGLTSPLSHALVKRDEAGRVMTIWAGDLLRVERKGAGFQAFVSNSLRAQGQMGTQKVAACTRMAAPICVSVVENINGDLGLTECLPDPIAFAGVPGGGLGGGPFDPSGPLGTGPSGSGGGSNGVGPVFGIGGGGSGSDGATGTTGTDFDEILVFTTTDPDQTDGDVLDTTDPPDDGDDGGGVLPPVANDPPMVIPLPAAGLMLLGSLALAGLIGRRRRG